MVFGLLWVMKMDERFRVAGGFFFFFFFFFFWGKGVAGGFRCLWLFTRDRGGAELGT